MDTVTQALLGATVAQAGFGRRLGRQAPFWGAIGGLIPDLDAVVAAPFGEFASMVHHRGITHALWFGPVLGAALGYATWRWRCRAHGDRERLGDWVGLWTLALLTHPLLDLFTSYGTQLLAPFSNRRFAIDAVGILDPFYSLVLLAAVLIGLVTPGLPRVGKWCGYAALGLTTGYLLLGQGLNARAERIAARQLEVEGVQIERLRSFPTLLQLSLRRVVAVSDDAVRVGYLSMLTPSRIAWVVLPRHSHPLLDDLAATHRGRTFTWFARELVLERVEPLERGWRVKLSDVRYGLPPDAEQGFWGIRAEYDEHGQRRGEVERFRRPVATGRALRDLAAAARGHDPCTYRVGLEPGAPPPRC